MLAKETEKLLEEVREFNGDSDEAYHLVCKWQDFMEETENIPSMKEVGYIPKERRYKYAPNCAHQCSGNCRRSGCNCECGEFHGYYEEERE